MVSAGEVTATFTADDSGFQAAIQRVLNALAQLTDGAAAAGASAAAAMDAASGGVVNFEAATQRANAAQLQAQIEGAKAAIVYADEADAIGEARTASDALATSQASGIIAQQKAADAADATTEAIEGETAAVIASTDAQAPFQLEAQKSADAALQLSEGAQTATKSVAQLAEGAQTAAEQIPKMVNPLLTAGGAAKESGQTFLDTGENYEKLAQVVEESTPRIVSAAQILSDVMMRSTAVVAGQYSELVGNLAQATPSATRAIEALGSSLQQVLLQSAQAISAGALQPGQLFTTAVDQAGQAWAQIITISGKGAGVVQQQMTDTLGNIAQGFALIGAPYGAAAQTAIPISGEGFQLVGGPTIPMAPVTEGLQGFSGAEAITSSLTGGGEVEGAPITALIPVRAQYQQDSAGNYQDFIDATEAQISDIPPVTALVRVNTVYESAGGAGAGGAGAGGEAGGAGAETIFGQQGPTWEEAAYNMAYALGGTQFIGPTGEPLANQDFAALQNYLYSPENPNPLLGLTGGTQFIGPTGEPLANQDFAALQNYLASPENVGLGGGGGILSSALGYLGKAGEGLWQATMPLMAVQQIAQVTSSLISPFVQAQDAATNAGIGFTALGYSSSQLVPQIQQLGDTMGVPTQSLQQMGLSLAAAHVPAQQIAGDLQEISDIATATGQTPAQVMQAGLSFTPQSEQQLQAQARQMQNYLSYMQQQYPGIAGASQQAALQTVGGAWQAGLNNLTSGNVGGFFNDVLGGPTGSLGFGGIMGGILGAAVGAGLGGPVGFGIGGALGSAAGTAIGATGIFGPVVNPGGVFSTAAANQASQGYGVAQFTPVSTALAAQIANQIGVSAAPGPGGPSFPITPQNLAQTQSDLANFLAGPAPLPFGETASSSQDQYYQNAPLLDQNGNPIPGTEGALAPPGTGPKAGGTTSGGPTNSGGPTYAGGPVIVSGSVNVQGGYPSGGGSSPGGGGGAGSGGYPSGGAPGGAPSSLPPGGGGSNPFTSSGFYSGGVGTSPSETIYPTLTVVPPANLHSTLSPTFDIIPPDNLHTTFSPTFDIVQPTNLHTTLSPTFTVNQPDNLHTTLSPTFTVNLPTNLHTELSPTFTVNLPTNLHTELSPTITVDIPSNIHTDISPTFTIILPANLHTDISPTLTINQPSNLHTTITPTITVEPPPPITLPAPVVTFAAEGGIMMPAPAPPPAMPAAPPEELPIEENPFLNPAVPLNPVEPVPDLVPVGQTNPTSGETMLAPGIFGASNAALGLAGGTEGFEGGIALVGELGPELVQLPIGARVIPNRMLPSFAAGTPGGGTMLSSPIVIQVNMDGRMLASALGPYLTDTIRLNMGVRGK